MKNRTKTYVAFYVDETKKCNNSIATCPDYNSYNLMKSWKKNENNDFTFTDPHEHNQVEDGESRKKLFQVLHERLDASKNMVLLLSNTTQESSALREEIEYGIDKCNLPVIIVFLGLTDEVAKKNEYGKYCWTKQRNDRIGQLPALKKRINSNAVTTMSIASFKQDKIMNAMKEYSVNNVNDKKQHI